MFNGYLKENVGWLCPEPHPFQKSCKKRCWVHRFFFFELCFIIEGNNFLTCLERHALVDRVIKTFLKEKDFNEFFSRGIIERMAIPTGKKLDNLLN